MTNNVTTPDCPPGLQYLILIDQLLVRRTFACKSKTEFIIKNTLGLNVMHRKMKSNQMKVQKFSDFLNELFSCPFDQFHNWIELGVFGLWRQGILSAKVFWIVTVVQCENLRYLPKWGDTLSSTLRLLAKCSRSFSGGTNYWSHRTAMDAGVSELHSEKS